MKSNSVLFVFLITITLLMHSVNRCCAQKSSSPTTGLRSSGPIRAELATIDTKTRWTLRTLPSVTVSSTIIRLGDVVRPLDPKMPLWQRLRSAPIAMFPLNGKSMVIERDRLDKAIRRAEATPRTIEWLGPTNIKVVHQPDGRRTTAKHPIAKVGYQQIIREETAVSDGQETIDAATADRIALWIKLALDRGQAKITASFDVQIDRQQPGIGRLRSVSGVTSVEPIGEVSAGVCQFRVLARSPNGPIESTVAIELVAFPKVVVPRITLARGHRISKHDLSIQSIPSERIDENQITDPSKIVGMEVRKTLRIGQPISYGDVGSPILVHRGDLVELRVMSGGVTVTTNAKSLDDGAESDLIEIETMRPRKRLVARVAQTGLVEIVTRAPATRYREPRQ